MKIRIIAGQWRGRKISVLDKPGLRPTPNRLRETLFNWLTPYLPGSKCLDLFAGSGALGIEAASRGAEQVLLVEKEFDIIKNLHQHIITLNSKNIKIKQMDAITFLQKETTETFDIVFLDPPFEQNLLIPCSNLLEPWLNKSAYIYLETNANIIASFNNWQIIRQKKVGQVLGTLMMKS
ncbi:16S rRNA (guanine(966)-N(2))-methyltransferase RsmD [Candidatus Halobeggiatoa sp. HSG11]|nr:16S rRNA (guanine(966)-N(2))-methyltransferase RsmD [Candidatus Halobeggiatoa sp. HSG11]